MDYFNQVVLVLSMWVIIDQCEFVGAKKKKSSCTRTLRTFLKKCSGDSYMCQFTCSSSSHYDHLPKCIPRHQMCDGEQHCPGGDDEARCSCTQVPKIENGHYRIEPKKKAYIGVEAILECSIGFKMVGTPTIRCLSNGDWSSPSALCLPTPCADLPTVDNGKFEMIGDIQRLATLSCNNGYNLTETPTLITCSPHGTWTKSTGYCIKDCGGLPHVDFGFFRLDNPNNNIQGAKAILTCFPGYQMTGQSFIECINVNGKLTWNDIRGKCEILNCGGLPHVDFGYFRLDNPYNNIQGAKAILTCFPGYQMTDSSLIECINVNGKLTWNDVRGKCEILACPDLPTSGENGLYELVDSRGGLCCKAIFVCGPGVPLCESADATLNVNRKWTIVGGAKCAEANEISLTGVTGDVNLVDNNIDTCTMDEPSLGVSWQDQTDVARIVIDIPSDFTNFVGLEGAMVSVTGTFCNTIQNTLIKSDFPLVVDCTTIIQNGQSVFFQNSGKFNTVCDIKIFSSIPTCD